MLEALMSEGLMGGDQFVQEDTFIQEDAEDTSTLSCTNFLASSNVGSKTCTATACRKILFKDGGIAQGCSIADGETSDGCAVYGQPACCTNTKDGTKIICSEGKDFVGAPKAADFATCSTPCKVQTEATVVPNTASARASFAMTALFAAVAASAVSSMHAVL